MDACTPPPQPPLSSGHRCRRPLLVRFMLFDLLEDPAPAPDGPAPADPPPADPPRCMLWLLGMAGGVERWLFSCASARCSAAAACMRKLATCMASWFAAALPLRFASSVGRCPKQVRGTTDEHEGRKKASAGNHGAMHADASNPQQQSPLPTFLLLTRGCSCAARCPGCAACPQR